MADLQATAELINWSVKGITIILMIIAASLAIKKKKNLALGIIILGNLVAYFFTQSPLVGWIVSIAGIIWVSSAKSDEQNKHDTGNSNVSTVQKNTVKVGNIIGLVIGIGLVAGPLIGYFKQEASLSDPTTQGVLILFAVIGGFMVINNLFSLLSKDSPVSVPVITTAKTVAKTQTEIEDTTNKIRCRFCKKLYSSEYNGCPYCKKK